MHMKTQRSAGLRKVARKSALLDACRSFRVFVRGFFNPPLCNIKKKKNNNLDPLAPPYRP
jgi:hypothetical protein